jgi:hypothetical protein
MILLNDRILQKFEKRGLRINEGIAVDARLVESASKPLSNDEIRKEREKKETPEGKLDKNGNPLKFSRKVKSDWTIKNDKPHYGLKEHASNKWISKKTYIVEQYFGLSHLYNGAHRARFTTIAKNIWDAICRQMAFNMFRGNMILERV